MCYNNLKELIYMVLAKSSTKESF